MMLLRFQFRLSELWLKSFGLEPWEPSLAPFLEKRGDI